jgi:hypothetical protein
MYKIIENIDTAPLLDAYSALESNMSWTIHGQGNRQCGLQYTVGEDPWTSAVGKTRLVSENSFSNLNDYFKDTIFESIIEKYQLKRTRLMWVGPYRCYSLHYDLTARIHIPLITHPNCFFVFKDEKTESVNHLPAGAAYWVDTTRMHTFINCSDTYRLHLVGAVDG